MLMEEEGARVGPPRTPDEFRDWLREIRERAGFSQEVLATMIGTDRRNLHRWERAGHDPGGLMLLRILDAVGQRIVPLPARGIPRPAGVELRELREEIASMRSDFETEAKRRMDAIRHVESNQEHILARVGQLLEALGVPHDGRSDPDAVRGAVAEAMAPALEATLARAFARHEAGAQAPPARSPRRARHP
jgi:transcriptional regulator with XRE-family HTH domain